MTVALEGAILYPEYPLYRRLGGPQGRSGWEENLAPQGFNPWTVQPIVTIPTELPSPQSQGGSKHYNDLCYRLDGQ
jgi:hypothetical protein